VTPQALFGLVFAPAGLAVIIALVADMSRSSRLAGLGVSALLVASGFVGLVGGAVTKPAVVGSFISGGHASSLGGAVLLLAGLGVLGAGEGRSGAATLLAAIASVSAALAVSSTDLVSLVICLEAAALCSYALVSEAGTARAQEAAMKYFVQGAVATGLLVLTLAAFIPASAQIGFAGVASAGGVLSPFGLGVMALCAALAFKTGAAPFHSWAPDAYEQARPSSAAVLSGPVKLAMIAALASAITMLRASGASGSEPLGAIGLETMAVLGAIALLSVVIGSTIALDTPSYTRMLGYAGVTQVGYALIALAAMGPSAAVGFAVTYAVASTGAFLAAGWVKRVRPDWDGRIASMSGLAAEHPVVSSALTLILMSLAGIPPLYGFWGKFQAFGAAIGSSAALADAGIRGPAIWLGMLAAAGIVGSIVSLGYYGAVVKAMYFAEKGGIEHREAGQGDHSAIAVVIVAAILLLAGLVPLALGATSTMSIFLLG
jgi:NADH-quinone oxidoreductase subunit N